MCATGTKVHTSKCTKKNPFKVVQKLIFQKPIFLLNHGFYAEAPQFKSRKDRKNEIALRTCCAIVVKTLQRTKQKNNLTHKMLL